MTLDSRIRPRDLPTGALPQRYRDAGAYTDCYAVEVADTVSLADYIEAFYTTWLFRLERLILAVAVSRPSTDAQARALANGATETFAAWSVEARAPDQLLLCDLHGRTRSWLMREPVDGGTRLYFGSAVVPVADRRTGERRRGAAFGALLGLHRLYSRMLLRAAVVRLR